MEESEVYELIGLSIDKLVNLDLSFRGVIGSLYDAAYRKTERSLTLVAAEKLKENVNPDDVVIITTGCLLRPLFDRGETDGPPGAAVLARAINQAFDAVPVVITDEILVPATKEVIQAGGLGIAGVDEAKMACSKKYPRIASVIPFSLEKDQRETSKDIINELKPTAIISVERAGMNEKGVKHSLEGFSVSHPLRANIDYLFEEARAQDILTIGIGDGGNEIGFGGIKDDVRRSLKYGAKCQCPCEGGIAAVTETDVLVTAGVSNMGAYGIVSCLSALLKDPELLHNGAHETYILERAIAAGFIDGGSGRAALTVDRLPVKIQVNLIDLLNETVLKGLERTRRPLTSRKA